MFPEDVYKRQPEARIILAQAVLYVSTAPKSNSAIKAIDAALNVANNGNSYHIPVYLKDSHYPGALELGHGRGYKYPHEYEHNYVSQQYLPDELKEVSFYFPSGNGHEKTTSSYISEIKG